MAKCSEVSHIPGMYLYRTHVSLDFCPDIPGFVNYLFLVRGHTAMTTGLTLYCLADEWDAPDQ